MVNKRVLSITCVVILLVFFILGFKFGKDITTKTACTEMYCECENNLDGEIPCNSCGVEDPIFLSGIFNVYKYCDAREIIICENGERKTRIDVEKESCKYRWKFFEFIVEI